MKKEGGGGSGKSFEKELPALNFLSKGYLLEIRKVSPNPSYILLNGILHFKAKSSPGLG